MEPVDMAPGLEGAVGAGRPRSKDSSGGRCSIGPFEGNLTGWSGDVGPREEPCLPVLDLGQWPDLYCSVLQRF